MSTHAQRLPFGAELLGPQRTCFTLWAPDCASVALELEGREPIAMARSGDGTFSCEAPCGAGARYRYRVAPDLAVPDPASRAQHGDVDGPSVVVDPRAYRWRHADWRGRAWADSVVYELHAGLLGGFAGVRAELARLRELGVTTIELMPVAEFRGARNWGYDGVLPFAPEASYGPPDALKALIDEAHGLELAVMLDVVYNHFGPDGNFLPRYASRFFRRDRQTPWGAGIDFREWHVREFFIANALYWLNEFRCDGLRFDAAHAIDDDGFLNALAERVREGVEAGRQVQLVLEDEREEDALLRGRFDARWHDTFHNSLHVLLTGEREGYYAKFAEAPATRLAKSLGDCDLAPQGCVAFLQNHDQVGNRAFGERLALLADEAALRAATLLHLLSPQVPLLFMGEEWGCRRPFLFFTDFEGELAAAVREGRRREFARFRAFADAAQRARIPDPNDPDTFEASKPCHPERSERSAAHHAYVRALLRLRQRALAPQLNRARAIGSRVLGPAAVAARWQIGGHVLSLAANLGADAVAHAVDGEALAESGDGVFDALVDGVLPPRSAAALWERNKRGQTPLIAGLA